MEVITGEAVDGAAKAVPEPAVVEFRSEVEEVEAAVTGAVTGIGVKEAVPSGC